MINPHNPEFITKRPWYLGESGPSLVHHSKQKVDAVLTMKKADELVQQRWASKKKVASGFRKVRPTTALLLRYRYDVARLVHARCCRTVVRNVYLVVVDTCMFCRWYLILVISLSVISLLVISLFVTSLSAMSSSGMSLCR